MVELRSNMRKKKNLPTICLGADHAGFSLKEAIKRYLVRLGYETLDFGAYEEDPEDDYPDFVIPAARAAVRLKGRAIVFGGSGTGECVAANKVRGVRCALPYNTMTARLASEHNNANAVALGGRTVTGDERLAKRIVKTWLETPFPGGTRHVRRLNKIAKYEKSC